MASSLAPDLDTGVEWLVDAYGCSPAALRDADTIGRVFARAVEELGLHPIGAPRFHTFPEPGGVTGMLMLSESHLACHTFPERAFAAWNLYCCKPRPEWPWAERLAEIVGAERVVIRKIERSMRGTKGGSP